MSGSFVREKRVIPEDVVEDFARLWLGIPLQEKRGDDLPDTKKAEDKRVQQKSKN